MCSVRSVDAIGSAVELGNRLAQRPGSHLWIVAQKSAAATAKLRPKIGRARPLAERSLGTPDAGAVSLAMCIGTVAEALHREGCNTMNLRIVVG